MSKRFDYDNYYRAEYIQSSGTQYIDTGVNFTSNPTYRSGIDIKFNLQVISGQTALGGCENNGNTWNFATQIYNNALRNYHGTLSAWQSVSISTNTDYVMSLKQMGTNFLRDLNGTIVTGTTTLTGATKTFMLFAENTTNAGINQQSSYKLYYCKIYDNGSLVRDFIPAMRKIDSVIGLFDLVTGNFYTNSGIGSFTGNIYYTYTVTYDTDPYESGYVTGVGSNIESPVVLTAIPFSKYKFLNWEIDIGYTRLQYIRATGTQYIDTGVVAKGGIRAKYKSKFSSGYCLLSSGDNDSNLYEIQNHYLGYPVYSFGTWSNRTQMGVNDTGIWIEYDVTLNNGNQTAYRNGAQYASSSYSSTNVSRTFYLFCRHVNATGTNWFWQGDLEYMKIYEGGTLSRDFIPVIRHSDGQIGLLDMLTLTFHGNLGTGSFIGGPVYVTS